MNSKGKWFIIIILFLLFQTERAFSQDLDSVKTVVQSGDFSQEVMDKDSAIDRHTEVSPLDIGSDRGLFILSSDKLMQMRILGSVRTLINYNTRSLQNDNSFNPYEIPTVNKIGTPNVYAGLLQSRLGFEITRRTNAIGDIFVRLESDFGGKDGSFRIRHAYGQTRYLLVGQTWSLFSNVSYLPATVDQNGPVGSIGIRTPQIRYFRKFNDKISWYAGMEFSSNELNAPDSIGNEVLQVIPDFTGKVDLKNDKFSMQISAIITTISTKNEVLNPDQISYLFGYGVSLAGSYPLTKKDKIYFSATFGRAISHYLDIYNGKGEDAVYNPVKDRFEGLVAYGAYAAYNRQLPKNLSFIYSVGFSSIINKDYQMSTDFNIAYNSSATIFWEASKGSRAGLEYAFGERFDIGNTNGTATRVSLLLYYDF